MPYKNTLDKIIADNPDIPLENIGEGAYFPNKNTSNGAVSNNDRAESINNPDQMVYWEESAHDSDMINFDDVKETNKQISKYAKNLTINSIVGIEGIPYQFLDTVDRRVEMKAKNTNSPDNNILTSLGRKYTEKIITQIPLLFLAPCKPAFMDDNGFTNNDKNLFLNAMVSVASSVTPDSIEDMLKGSGKFYTADYDYSLYYNYLNCMLTTVACYMGIENEYVWIGNDYVQIKNADWSKEVESTDFGQTIMAKKNLIFYMDSIDTINENFENSTRPSQFASLINGFSDTAKEIDYFFGSSGANTVSSLKQSASSAVAGIASGLSNVVENFGGGIVGSLFNGGVQSIIDGGKIVFPDMWDDSSFGRSYSINIKLRSPDNDSLSIFLNVLKPYCKILCLTLPHMIDNNVNTYRTPFLVKAYCKGLFNVDMGIINALSVSKGATCCWNDDGLPTQIDLDIDIKDLYSQLTMTGYEKDSTAGMGILKGIINSFTGELRQTYNIVNNTTYMDFLANMAGLNINEAVWNRKILMYYDLFSNNTLTAGNLWNRVVGSRISNAVTNFMGKYVYSW